MEELKEVKIGLVADLDIEFAESGGTTISIASGMVNATIVDDGDQAYVTQRSGVRTENGAPATANSWERAGRGIIYWPRMAGHLHVHYNGVYLGQQPLPTFDFGSSFYRKVYLFLASDEHIIFVDPDEDSVRDLDYDGPAAVEITDPNRPSDITLGGAYLDGYLFLMTAAGVIHNSTLNDVTTWAALDFIGTGRLHDRGVYLGQMSDHVVAYSQKSIEFFFNAGHPSGSPLSRRSDIYYQSGCADGESVWEAPRGHFFVGLDNQGRLEVFSLIDFQLTAIGSPGVNQYLAYIKNLTLGQDYRLIGAGYKSRGSEYYCLSVVHSVPNAPGRDQTPIASFVYDIKHEVWSMIEGWVGDRYGPLALIQTINTDSLIGNITGLSVAAIGAVIASDDSYRARDTGNEVPQGNINMSLISPRYDYGTRNNKRMASLRADMIVVDHAGASQPGDILVQWRDDAEVAFNAGVAVELALWGLRIRRMGRFFVRSFRFSCSLVDQVRIKGVICKIRKSKD